jgi:galactose mutarotase-like enzyme
LLRAKHKAWVTAKLTGDKTPFITARRTAKAAIRAYHRNTEQRLIYANDKSAFFSYIYNKTKEPHATINLNIDGRDVSQDQAADIFCKEFESNFSSATNICTPVTPAPKMIFYLTALSLLCSKH